MGFKSFVLFFHERRRSFATAMTSPTESWCMLDSVLDRLTHRQPTTNRVGLFVDGPNVFRTEFDVDLADLREAVAPMGLLAISRLYLNEHATPGLIQAAEAHGFEVVITSGDVDVKLAIDATAAIAEGRLDIIAIASRDTDFKPVLEYAGRHGLETVAIAPGEHGRSDALQAVANTAFTLEE